MTNGPASSASELDLATLRSQTPGVEHRIHFNNAGAGLMPQSVLRSIKDHLDLESQIGGYEAADARREEIREAYGYIASLIHAQPHNIAVMENATVAFNTALSAIPFHADDVILTTRHDYVSNQIAFLNLQERLGVRVVRAPDAPEGGVDVQGFKELTHRLRPRVATVTHVPTNSGLVQPVVEIAAACRERNVPVIVDACQSVGQMAIDVRVLDPDFLSATARKFLRGPRGVGFLYVSDRVLEQGLSPLFPDLRGAEWIDENLFQPEPYASRFENWEFAYGLVLGMGEAARYAGAVGIERIEQRVTALAGSLRERLGALSGMSVHDRGTRLSGIVTVSCNRHPAQHLKSRLSDHAINTGVSARSYAVLDFDEKGIDGALRISPHYYNTDSEMDVLVETLAGIVAG